MGVIGPRYSTDFDVIPKGTYLFEAKESGIENTNPKEGKPKRHYWVRLAVVDGENEGMTHRESFYSDTKDDFSFQKMFGFLIKLGIMPSDLTTIDTKIFLSEKFEDRFRRGIKGARMGGKITWRYKEEDKAKENPQSEMRTYYTEAEVMELLGKRDAANQPDSGGPEVSQKQEEPTVDEWGRPIRQVGNPATTTGTEPPPATDKPRPPWT